MQIPLIAFPQPGSAAAPGVSTESLDKSAPANRPDPFEDVLDAALAGNGPVGSTPPPAPIGAGAPNSADSDPLSSGQSTSLVVTTLTSSALNGVNANSEVIAQNLSLGSSSAPTTPNVELPVVPASPLADGASDALTRSAADGEAPKPAVAEIATSAKEPSVAENVLSTDVASEIQRSQARSEFAAPSALPSTLAASLQAPQSLNHEKRLDHVDVTEDGTQASSSQALEMVGVQAIDEKNGAAKIQGAAIPTDQISEALLSSKGELESTGRAEIRLRLDPPELGAVHVHLSGNGRHLTGRIVVEELATQALLENQMQNLRHRLEEAGFKVARFEIAWQGSQHSSARHNPQQGFGEFNFQRTRSFRGTGTIPLPRAARGTVDLLA